MGVADARTRSRDNLLYMLSVSGRLPIRERDLASLKIRRRSLLDVLVAVFAERLRQELRRGCDHAYVRREENLRVVKGKLLLVEHIRQNRGRMDRAFVAYDEFVADTWLNRILKAGCRKLLSSTGSARASQHLREIMLELADVEDRAIELADFDRVQYSRSSERFVPFVEFCRLILFGQTPAPSMGATETFSLLFPMDRLFESFIGNYLWRYAGQFGLERRLIRLQGKGVGRWLLREQNGSGKFLLKPDVVVMRPGTPGSPGFAHARQASLVLDTKWKRLKGDIEDPRNGVSQGDMYQLYAYANRYECPDNVLLYPKVPGVTPNAYVVEGDPPGRRVRVALVDVSGDLTRDRSGFDADLRAAIGATCSVDHVQAGIT